MRGGAFLNGKEGRVGFRKTTSAERYCNEEPNSKIMKFYISIKPGATFFLGSSRTLVYHKDDVEIIYKTKFIDAVNNLYLELNSHCPLKLERPTSSSLGPGNIINDSLKVLTKYLNPW